MDTITVLTAFGFTLISGLATSFGSLLALVFKRTDTRFLSFALGLSAGVMVYVSFMELMPEAVEQFRLIYSDKQAELFMLLAFFSGITLIALIDRFVPEEENPHEMRMMGETNKNGKLRKTGLMMALAIGIHNFPEGLATFTTALGDIEFALPIMFAIAVHNIPEGIAVSVPVYQSTGSRRKAFWYATLSGLAEPIGALFGYLFLFSFWTAGMNAFLLAMVSGIMVYISFDELLPGTEKYGHHHWGIGGVIAGMAVMALSLLVL